MGQEVRIMPLLPVRHVGCVRQHRLEGSVTVMDIWRLLAAAMRRWYVFLAVLALALAAAWAVGERVQPEYTASSSILLVPPVLPAAGNPYADLDTAASSVGIVLQSGPTRGDFARRGLSADYEVAAIPRTPIMRFTVRSGDPNVAIDTATALIDQASEELLDRQQAAGVAVVSQVRVDVLEPAIGATESTRSQFQAQVGVAGVGVVLAFVAAVFMDDVLLLIRRRRQSRSAESTQRRSSRSTRGRRPTGLSASSDEQGKSQEHAVALADGAQRDSQHANVAIERT